MKEVKITLLLVLFFICYETVNSHLRKKNRPHIFLIIGDDIGYNDVGWNNERVHTPYMNKLAEEGVILDNYYSHHLCTPSRAALLSGHYADRLGMQRGVLTDTQPYGIPLKYTLLPQKMSNLGYNAVAVGKWHVGYCSWSYTPLMRGFRSWLGFYNGAEENYRHCASYFKPNLTDGSCVGFDFNDGVEIAYQYTKEFSGPLYSQRIVNIIRNHKEEDQPIFAYISLTESHWPLQAPARFVEKCNESVNSARQHMCAAMASMDEEVQSITEALKGNGMYNNSIIIFVSDNGGSVNFGGNNYPMRGDKGTLYDGACHVPAFVHSNLLRKTGYRSKKLFHVTDWYPTLLHVAGGDQDIDSSIDGYNQWNVLNHNRKSVRHSLPYNLDVSDEGIYMAAVRDEQYKLIAGPGGFDGLVPESETQDKSFNYTYLDYYTSGKHTFFDFTDTQYKLFDLKNDPSESKNIADENPDVVNRLEKLLISYRRRSRPAMSVYYDENGVPSKHNNTYVPGWCDPYYDTPMYAINETNSMTFQLL